MAGRKAFHLKFNQMFPIRLSRAAKQGGVQTGGLPDLDLSFLFCPFWDFPDFSGIFPISWGTLWGFSRFVLFSSLGLFFWQRLRGTVPKGSATQSGPFPKKAADRERGSEERGHVKNVKNRQKVSNILSTRFDIFRAGQRTSKIVKKCQTYFRHFSRGTSFPAPCGGLWKKWESPRFSFSQDKSNLNKIHKTLLRAWQS